MLWGTAEAVTLQSGLEQMQECFDPALAGFFSQAEKPSLGGWALLLQEDFRVYGVTDWTEWLPCGTAINAVGLAPVG